MSSKLAKHANATLNGADFNPKHQRVVLVTRTVRTAKRSMWVLFQLSLDYLG